MTREQKRVIELMDERLHLLQRNYATTEKGAGTPQNPPTKTDLQNKEKLERLMAVIVEFRRACQLLQAHYEAESKRMRAAGDHL